MEQTITVGMVLWGGLAVVGMMLLIGVVVLILKAIGDGFSH